MKQRIRNSPSIRAVIHEFLAGRMGPTSLDEVYDHVAPKVTLTSQTPRASVVSVLSRMPDVVRTQPGKYMLISNSKEPK